MAEPGTGMILILEDDPGIAHLERLRLQRAGFEVVIATTAEDARRRVARGGIDLLVLDQQLKGTSSGLDVQTELRAAGLGVPAILVTGFGDADLLAEALRAGVRDFLPKTPDYLDYLVPTVERVMSQVGTERQLEAERARRLHEEAARAESEAQRQALREADRRKDEFLSMLAHELRNPLAAIRNAVALIRRSTDEAQRIWAVDVIDRQAGQLARLVDDLLDVSRVGAGKIQLRMRRLNGAEIVAHTIEVVRPFIEARQHTLDIEVRPGPHWIQADPTRLEQVLVNLLTNAAKYTDEGGRITLRAGTEGAEFVVSVRDSGVGIPAELLPRIFDLYMQVEGSLDRSHGGLGIGLTLVRRLVEMHRGRVSATSDGPGQGSEFTVRLPIAMKAEPAASISLEESNAPGDPREGPDERPAERAPSAGSEHGPRRILVVDDDSDTVRSLLRLLRTAGHEVQAAGDGRAAIELARTCRPEVVLLDVGLPGMDGYQVAERLRREAGLTDAVFVGLSGYVPARDHAAPPEARFDHHLVKPVDVETLLGLIEGFPSSAPVTAPDGAPATLTQA